MAPCIPNGHRKKIWPETENLRYLKRIQAHNNCPYFPSNPLIYVLDQKKKKKHIQYDTTEKIKVKARKQCIVHKTLEISIE